MNARSHATPEDETVGGIPRDSIATALRSPYLIGNELSSHLETRDEAWWSSLIIRHCEIEAGIEHRLVTDAEGHEWRLQLADWGSPAADRLQSDARFGLTLGEDLAEPPLFIGAGDRLALVYPGRRSETLADRAGGDIGIGDFLRLAAAATHALARLHAAGIIHGRLAPGRLLVDADGRVRFTGFAWASATEFGVTGDHPLLASDMPYAAPELIRTDAAPIDARTDLYAMGVLLYELLVGAPPLVADDMAGWLHAHVAREALPVRAVRPETPEAVDDILLKLISKDPKQRYQTARALHADVRRVAEAFAAKGHVERFELARGEFADPARRSAGIVGRRGERAAMARLYAEFLASSRRSILLVAGEAGTGKSTLVESFVADIRSGSAICTACKGVELRQGTPFAPMAQLLRTALAHIMGGDEQRLDAARARLAEVVGSGRILADLVPEAGVLPAAMHALADVPAHLAQARSARIIAGILAALASPEAPLVLFLDDLQWFDHGSLNVFRQLCDDMPANIFLIVSFRSEAESRKPVREILDIVRASPAFANELKLEPFSGRDTNELVALILKSTPEEVRRIAEVVQRETGGNPFHVGQLLERARDEDILAFDADRQGWVWSEHRRRRQHEITALMQERLAALAPLQRGFLQRCASLGGRVSVAFVAALTGASVEETLRAANALVAAGLVRRVGGEFVIAHDRVLEAAYAAMAPSLRARVHLGNARLMAADRSQPDAGRAFEIASQIERCDLGDLSAEERPLFAETLLRAARTCRSAGEAKRALHFVELIRTLLPAAREDALAALTFETEWLQCDCLLALGRSDEALAALATLPALALDATSIADIRRLEALALTIKGSYREAIAATLDGLRALGIDLEPDVAPAALEKAYRDCQKRLDTCSLEALVALPDMTDPRTRSALALLSTLISSFFVEGELRFLHVIKMIELTLDHGAAPESAYGFAWFGVLSAHHFGAYESGAGYSAAACALAQRDGYEAQRTATLLALDQVSAWTRPMRTALGHAREGARVAQAAGDLGMACYARNHVASDLLIVGDHLDRIRSELVDSIAMTRAVGYRDIELILSAQLNFVDALASGEASVTITDTELDAASVATRFWVRHYAGLEAFFHGRLDAAVRELGAADTLAWAAPAHIDTASNSFFLAIAEARRAAIGPLPEKGAGRLDLTRRRFEAWARLNPETFSARRWLLEAEAARLAGRRSEAMDFYQRAVDAAAEANFGHDLALAQELAAAFYREAGLGAPAQGCLQAALRHYRQWGAHAKAARFGSHLVPGGGFDDAGGEPGRMQRELDLSVMRAASQALAEEIGLEQTVRSLMKSMIVHAGAQFGLLLLLREGAPVIEAAARVRQSDVEITLRPPGRPEELMPASVLKTVLRTVRPVTMADAAVEAGQRGLSMDGRSIRSLACLPLVKRGELVGILYLENALSADVFTPRRMAMLEVLAPQAAISLDAARLYGDLMDENLRRAQAEFELREARSDLARANQMTAMGTFATSIAHEINQPLASLIAQADAGLRWLNRKEPDLGEVASSLGSIREAGRRAADIIAALRSLARQQPSTVGPVVIEDVLEDVLKIAAAEIDAKGIAVTVAMNTDRRSVTASETQLQQVLFNIITNAIQSMTGNPPLERRLHITASLAPSTVEVAIEDSGCGMSQEIVSRIFQPFFTTKTSGMGVGLAICRSIMEMHGGSLDVRSTEGKGSTFLVRIPTGPA